MQLNDSIANLLSGKLATSAIAAASIFLYVIVMLQYDVLLTSIAIAFVAVNLVTLQWVRRYRTDANTKLMQEYGKVQGIEISGLQSIETLKASALESDFFSRWACNYTKAINIRQQFEVTNQTLGILPTFLSGSASLLMLAIGGLRVMDGAMSIGMHTVVSEGGTNLSGGQRQRLLIARALALKPKILLFDEATSALDNTTQAIVSQSLDKLQVTRIVIAHRLSTICNAHRIYVLQAGRVIQQGTFQELATMEGLFAQLMVRQMM
ncbi:MAG: ABC transporter transmembrane domain-containing protein [Nostoc sp.]|uniref:ABC transporter transmembrane domain-containing protein n=1 Tax=Nostoc sp. TaxID=1180 RepID=UPI002FF81E31